jgi:hypothetical protein
MLGMELRLSADGTSQWCRDLASGFTFTIRQCTPLAPGIPCERGDPATQAAGVITNALADKVH